MILFSATSVYHLLEFMVLKYKKYRNESVTLFISEAIYRRYNNIYLLDNMFHKIVIFNNFVKFNGNVPINLVPYFSNLFKKNNIILEDYKEIYIAGAQHSMGIYMLQIKHNFIFLEEASGEVSRPHFLEMIESKLQHGKEYFCKNNGLYNADNPFITNIMCNFKTQDKNYVFTDKHIDFDVINELKLLDSNHLNSIVKFFIKQTLSTANNKTILFTQQFANLKIHTYDKHCLIYQLFVDYFLNNDKIVVKKHPMDNMNYSAFLSDIEVIQENFPSELIPLIYYNQNNKIATISSTSVKSLEPYFKHIIFLDNEYGMSDAFLAIHKYYFISIMIETIFKDSISIFIDGYTNLVLKFFLQNKHITFVSNIQEADVVILDNCTPLQMDINNISSLGNKIIIFPCSKNKYISINNIKEYLGNIVPIVIKKIKIHDSQHKMYTNLDDEVIYIIGNNKDIINNIKDIKMDKVLRNTGIELKKSLLTESEVRIKVLEGLICSLENKLEYVLNENKSLKEKLKIKE